LEIGYTWPEISERAFLEHPMLQGCNTTTRSYVEYDRAVQNSFGTRHPSKDESDQTHLQRYWADIERLPNREDEGNGERVSVDIEDLPVGSDISVDFSKVEWPKGFQMRLREELFSIVYFVE